jgi:DNA-binding response OmpR family regulator
VSVITADCGTKAAGTRTARRLVIMTNLPTILLLDEEYMMREATALLLSNRGGHVTKTATLDEALAELERRTYDVAVIDLHSASSNPTHVLHRIAEKAASPTRVIVCTDQPLSKNEPTGITDVLVKPYPFDRLLTAVFGGRSRTLERRSRSAVMPQSRRSKTLRRSTPLVRRGRA